MDALEKIGADKECDNKVSEEDSKTNIFNFKALQINDAINAEGHSAANYEDHNWKQTGANARNFKPQENMNQRRKIVDPTKRLEEKFRNEWETEHPLKGNWTLYCDPNSDSNGQSQAVEILKSAQDLHDTRPDLFQFPPFSCEKRNGTVVVCCYTPDYTDKDFNLKAARVIREEIHYPYVMYYHKRVGNLTSFYMHTPDDEFYVNNEGQWILEE